MKRLMPPSNKSIEDLIIVMGDLNAQVGNDNSNIENVMGVHGLGTMNENGKILVEMCTQSYLVNRGTLFPHKIIHKATWISADLSTENQIDHITISRK